MFSSVFSEFAQSRFDSTCQPSQSNENEVKDNNCVSVDRENNIALSSYSFYTKQNNQENNQENTDESKKHFPSVIGDDDDVHQSIDFDRNDDDVPTEIRCFDPKVTLVVSDADADTDAENDDVDDVDHKKSVQQNEEEEEENKTRNEEQNEKEHEQNEKAWYSIANNGSCTGTMTTTATSAAADTVISTVDDDSDNDDSSVVSVVMNTNETTETIVVNSRDEYKSGSEEKNAMTSTSCAPPLHSSVNKQEEEKREEKREVENKQETVENNNCSLSSSSSTSCKTVDTVHHNLPFGEDAIILKNKDTYLYKNRDENNSLWIYCDKGSSDEQNTKHPVPDETICVLCVFSVDTEDVDAMTRVKKHGNLLQKYSHKCEKHKLSQ